MTYLLVAGGLILLLLGGEFLVRGAVGLAQKLGVSQILIGATIVAYGTTAPELLVSMEANLSGAPDIALGNVVGSNIANILLILGVSAIIYPITCASGALKRGGPMMIVAAIVLVVLGWRGVIDIWVCVPMLGGLALYSIYDYQVERRMNGKRDAEAALHIAGAEDEAIDAPKNLPASLAALIAGLVGVIIGAHLLVEGSVALARAYGVSEAVIGLTLVAVGTSLPELTTGIMASLRRHSEVALGNVIGANTYNILGIMGFVPIFRPIGVNPSIAQFDIMIVLAVTFGFVAWMMWRCRLGRWTGVLFLLLYASYVACQYYGVSGMQIESPAAG